MKKEIFSTNIFETAVCRRWTRNLTFLDTKTAFFLESDGSEISDLCKKKIEYHQLLQDLFFLHLDIWIVFFSSSNYGCCRKTTVIFFEALDVM